MFHWSILALAIASEVTGTIFLKLSNGFEIWKYGFLVFVFYALSFWLLAQAITKIQLGTAYAVWAGIGTAVVALLSVALFNESMTLIKAVCILAIVGGVMGLHLSDNSVLGS